MIGNSGRAYPDYKLQASTGNVPFSQRFIISGVIDDLENYFQLASPLSDIADLPHNQPTTPTKVKVASTSNSDSTTGTGARVLFLTGLDEYGNLQEELIFMGGQIPYETNLTYSFVQELLILEYGSNTDANTGDSNCVGDIYCGTGTWAGGKPSNPLVGIEKNQNNSNSREGIFKVPAGKILLMRSLFCGAEPDKKENISLIVQLCFNLVGFGDNHWFKTEPYTFDGTFQYLPEFLLPIPPLSKLQIRAKTTIKKTKASTISLGVELRDIRL